MADAPVAAEAKAAIALAILLAIIALAIGDSTIAWIAGFAIAGLTIFAMARAPLRYSLMGLMIVSLMLENPTDQPAGGAWRSPLFPFSALMLAHMNQVTEVSWMSFSGSDLVLVALIVIALVRRFSKSKIDSKGRILSPRILPRLAFISLAGSLYVELHGIVTGGDFSKSLWQIEKTFYLPIVFLLFDAAIRGPQDFVALGRIVVAAACFKAAMAVYVMNWADVSFEPTYGTSHHDSLLFALAVVMLVSLLIHKARPSTGRVFGMVAPILLWGMIENNRRMVWAQILLVFITLYIAMPMTRVKKKIKRVLVRMSPLIALYVVVGWKFPTGFFKPVGTIKSMVQPANDMSTMTRDIENYNVAQMIRQKPLTGWGYGHGFIDLIGMPPMPHPLEPWLPHNSLLGLWFASGFVGYTAMTLLWTAGVFFGVRAYRDATRPIDRATALVCFGAVQMYLIQCYGDVGLGSWTAVYTVAPALAAGGKLAVISGAWPVGRDKAKQGAVDAEATAAAAADPARARAGPFTGAQV